MKKHAGVAVLAMMVASFCSANVITWENGDAETLQGVAPWTGQDPSGWAIGLYSAGVNGTMDFVSGATFRQEGAYITAGDDVMLHSTLVDPGFIIEGQIWWSVSGLTVADNARVFSVVFNDNDTLFELTDWAVNVDDELTTVDPFSATAPPFIYNAGTASAGEWYPLVPEPGSMALMALGLVTLAARGIRRRK